jgi:hypothetical protein
MNALLTRSVMQQAMSVLTSATPNNFAKGFCGGSSVSSPSAYKPFCAAPFSARAPFETYQQPYQHVTHFPGLVSAFGERIFTDYWN